MSEIRNSKEFFVPLGNRERFRVRVDIRPTEPPSYCIQLEGWFDDARGWEPVVRADDFHGSPHLDFLSPSGVQWKQWLPERGDCKANMKAAESWIRNNWKAQLERYKYELYGRGTPPER